MPQHLFIIVLVQAAAWIAMRIVTRTSITRTPTYWISAAGFGVTLGILMDVVLGSYGLFAYLVDGPDRVSTEPKDMPVPLLLFNAAVSYGIAVATFSHLQDRIAHGVVQRRRWMSIMGLVVALGMGAIFAAPLGTVGVMFVWGGVIVGGGELLLTAYGLSGPVISLVTRVSAAPFIKIWVSSIAVGSVYEITNALFPFWVWLPDTELSTLLVRIVMVMLGYFALVHPIVVFWALLGSRRVIGAEPPTARAHAR